MFLGHFALGFAAKRAAPSVSLGTLVLAAQAADLVWPALVLAGVERVEIAPGITRVTPLDFVSYPYSHSLVALALWGGLLGLGYAIVRRSGPRPALILAGLVLSHWVLDAASHRPDMPITLEGPERIGLGLWFSLPATLAVELSLFGAGIWIYLRSTRPLRAGSPRHSGNAVRLDREIQTPRLSGPAGALVLAGFLLAVYVASLVGPPPPSATVVAGSALSLFLVVAWAYWVDSKRSALPP